MQAAEAKREFDERAKGDRLEQYHDSAYYYWYNRVRKLKRAKTPDAEKISAVSEAFRVFRKEAVERKGKVKRGEMKISEFTSWIFTQQNEIDRIFEELVER